MKLNRDGNAISQKHNIAMFGHKRIPSREGGVEIVVEELAVRMVEKGYSVTCYNRRGHNVAGAEFDGDRPEEYKGIRIKDVFALNHRGFAAVTASIGASLAAALGSYDVVHIHAEGPAFMCWLPKLLGKRVIVTVHGLDHQRAKWGKLARLYIMLGERAAVRFADEIIVLSKNVQQYFYLTYGRKTKFIPNGVNAPCIRKAKQIVAKYGLQGNDYILFLGRLVPEKGLKYLIEAYKQVKTDKKLIIAGGSSDTNDFVEELKDMCGKDERIILVGFVQGELLEELYSNAYIYTLPSDLEGLPLSLLEAMSYGNCCLVSDIAECVEVVENHAITFKKSDTEDLKQKLQMLCDNPDEVNRYKACASGYICLKYDWDIIVKETLALYK